MPRPRTTSATPEQLKERTRKLFAHSPLNSFIPLMEETITSVAGTTDPSGKRGVEALVRLLDYYERLFSNGFGPRFDLDASLACDICRQWSTPALNLPDQIVPVYGNQWAYSLLPSPWTATNPVSVHAVCFPGRSEIADLNLLEYPWLCHELGHHLLSRAGPDFATNVKKLVGQVIKTASRKATADSPSLRAKSADLVRSLQELWTPRPNTRDWAHELAADSIALWTCGPAFLTAMQHALEHENIQPYEISETHPPYELRLRVLLDLAENLEWGSYCAGLKEIIQRWRTGTLTLGENNEYSALAEGSLAEQCCSHVVKACRSWNLPQCTPELMRHVQKKTAVGQDPDSASELILAAWSVHQDNPNASQAWESAALARLAKELHGDAGNPV